MKKNLLAGLIVGGCFVAPLASHAGLYSMGNAILELSVNGGTTAYDSVLANNGKTVVTLLSLGQALNIGGQIQTYTADYGTATTMHYQVNGGSWNSLDLTYSTGDGSSYDQWDSGAIVNIANLLTYAAGGYNNTLTVNYSAYNSIDNQIATYDNFGSSFTFDITAVPEPINYALFGFGFIFVGGTAGASYLGRRRSTTAS